MTGYCTDRQMKTSCCTMGWYSSGKAIIQRTSAAQTQHNEYTTKLSKCLLYLNNVTKLPRAQRSLKSCWASISA